MKPIIQTPRYRLVADEIVAAIRAGDLAPGAKMPADKDLVERLGVSRTTVREAMIALELMGYVVTRFGAGAFVAEALPEAPREAPAQPGFYELVEARYRIEPEIAAAAAPFIKDEDQAHLRDLIAGMADPALSLHEVERRDRDFHVTIARATGNSVFVSIVEEFWRARRRFPEWTRANNRRDAADVARFYEAEHRAILDAFAARDVEAARRAMRVH
ncbi:FadR family transcriptional regulator, partial [Limimaricola sp. ASW11-118]|nr:FadR family transcriptional regulator [Limimaricola litoreus]